MWVKEYKSATRSKMNETVYCEWANIFHSQNLLLIKNRFFGNKPRENVFQSMIRKEISLELSTIKYSILTLSDLVHN